MLRHNDHNCLESLQKYNKDAKPLKIFDRFLTLAFSSNSTGGFQLMNANALELEIFNRATSESDYRKRLVLFEVALKEKCEYKLSKEDLI